MDNRLSDGTRIDVVSDAICPWCYIGKRHLEAALDALAREGLRFSVHWSPFQLNPDLPPEGVDRAAYRTSKFGSAERAAALDARVAEAARTAGLDFRQDLMRRTPNTLPAHRLIRLAGARGVQDAAVEALFRAYFCDGGDISDPATLADCAATAGIDRAEAADFLAGTEAATETLADERAARAAGVSGVPSFFLDGYALFSGALPPEQIAEALRRAHRVLTEDRLARGATAVPSG